MRTRAICIVLSYILIHPFASPQWVRTTLDSSGVRCLAVSGSTLFAGRGGFQTGNGIFRSIDSGATWSLVAGPEIVGSLGVRDLSVSRTNIFACGESIYRSTDKGTTWSNADSGLPRTDYTSVAVAGTRLFAGSDSGVFVSTDDGTSWLSASSGLPANLVGCRVGAIGGNLVAGVQVGLPEPVAYIYTSTNNGTSWTVANPVFGIGTWFASFAVMGHTIFAGTNGYKVFRSTDGGLNWVQQSSPEAMIVFVSDTNLFVGHEAVWLSKDAGASWIRVHADLRLAEQVMSFAVLVPYVFVGTTHGLWRRPLSEMITDVQLEQHLPQHFVLEQNYPNPFNPSTTIRYSLPERSHVTLTVFNMLGQQVAVLQNGEQQAGYHEAVFDASGLGSGVYLYRLQAGDFVQTKKLVLVK